MIFLSNIIVEIVLKFVRGYIFIISQIHKKVNILITKNANHNGWHKEDSHDSWFCPTNINITLNYKIILKKGMINVYICLNELLLSSLKIRGEKLLICCC